MTTGTGIEVGSDTLPDVVLEGYANTTMYQ